MTTVICTSLKRLKRMHKIRTEMRNSHTCNIWKLLSFLLYIFFYSGRKSNRTSLMKPTSVISGCPLAIDAVLSWGVTLWQKASRQHHTDFLMANILLGARVKPLHFSTVIWIIIHSVLSQLITVNFFFCSPLMVRPVLLACRFG